MNSPVDLVLVLMAGSWLYLVLLRLSRAFTHSPRVEGPVLRLTRVAVFIAVLSVGLLAWVVASFAIVMPNFFSEIPPDKQALIDVAGIVAAGVGSLLGWLAARRVGTRWWL